MESARGHLLFAAMLVGLSACASPFKTNDQPVTDAAVAPVAATVDGETITVDDLDTWIKEDLFRRELGSTSANRLFEVRSEALERMINERVIAGEARRRGLDRNDMLEVEIAQRPVSDEEIDQFYEENKDRIQGGGEPEELKPRIRTHLERQRPGEIMADLRSSASVTIELDAPRVTVEGSGPARGPANARVVIVEFSDYQCPFCRRAEPTLNEIVKRYPTDVRWEYRHLPLPNHPQAKPAAEAAVCADAQGKFWEYHEKVFSQEGSLDTPGLLAYAEEVGLDLTSFETCQKAPETSERVAADQRAGQRAGAKGTPSFFVNGIFVSGARSVEDFEKLIQAELARAPQVAISSPAQP